MYRNVLTFFMIWGLYAPYIQAATEFLRFEGSIGSFYSSSDPGYDASLGFIPGQAVYFDFQIDTTLDAAGHPDTGSYPDIGSQDNFAVTYLAGSIAAPNETYGATSSFAEGMTTWLFVTDSLRVGTRWDSLGNPSDESIDTWAVGDPMALMNNSYLPDNIIGNLALTYRNSSPPNAYVPVPASLWLFGSALIGLIGVARRKKSADQH